MEWGSFGALTLPYPSYNFGEKKVFRKVIVFNLVWRPQTGWNSVTPDDGRKVESFRKHYKRMKFLGILPVLPRDGRVYQVIYYSTWFGLFQSYHIV